MVPSLWLGLATLEFDAGAGEAVASCDGCDWRREDRGLMGEAAHRAPRRGRYGREAAAILAPRVAGVKRVGGVNDQPPRLE